MLSVLNKWVVTYAQFSQHWQKESVNAHEYKVKQKLTESYQEWQQKGHECLNKNIKTQLNPTGSSKLDKRKLVQSFFS